MSNATSNNSEQTYFDLHVRGIGYLNRVREVFVKKGAPYLACYIAALHGSADAVEKTVFDCTVVGEEAQEVVRLFEQDSLDRKVLIGFTLGDPWVDQFTYGPNSPKAGTPGAMIKARLLRVDWLKVDNVLMWTRPKADEQAGATPAADAASVADVETNASKDVAGNESPAADVPKSSTDGDQAVATAGRAA